MTYSFTVELIAQVALPIGNQLLQQRILNKWSSFCSFCERWDLHNLGNQLLQQRNLNKWNSFCSFCERWDLQNLTHKRLLMTSRMSAATRLDMISSSSWHIVSAETYRIWVQLLQQRILNKWNSFCSFCERWDLQNLGCARAFEGW